MTIFRAVCLVALVRIVLQVQLQGLPKYLPQEVRAGLPREQGPFADRREPEIRLSGLDFVACDEPVSCSEGIGLPSAWMGDIVAELDEVTSEADLTPGLLHIGAAEFKGDNDGKFNWIDRSLWDNILKRFKDQRRAAKLFLVEGVPEYTDAALKNAVVVKSRHPQLEPSVLNTFVYDECDTRRTIYRFRVDLVDQDFGIRDFPVMANLRSEALYDTLKYWYPDFMTLAHRHGDDEPADLNQRFQALCHAKNLSSYVAEQEVTWCKTPTELLQEMGVRPEELCVAVFDMEGADISVVNAMLQIPAFKPKYIQYEDWDGLTGQPSAEGLQLRFELRQRGYTVGRSSMSAADDPNIIALLTDGMKKKPSEL